MVLGAERMEPCLQSFPEGRGMPAATVADFETKVYAKTVRLNIGLQIRGDNHENLS